MNTTQIRNQVKQSIDQLSPEKLVIIAEFLDDLIHEEDATELEEITINQTKSNGQKMAEALSKISKNDNFANIAPQKWQKEIRQDRTLPNRD